MARTRRSRTAPSIDAQSGEPDAITINRRDFFRLTSAGAAAFGLEACTPGGDANPDFRARLTRREDLVSLGFEFFNLKLEAADGGGQQIVLRGSGTGFIVVQFEPQHVFEEAKQENPLPVPPIEKPVDALVAGRSRVALRVEADTAPIPYTAQGLLDALETLEMNVAPNALPPERTTLTLSEALQDVAPSQISQLVQNTAARRNMILAGQQLALSSGIDATTVATASDSVATRAQAQALFPPGASTVTVPPALQPVVSVLLKPRPALPTNEETALEVPFRLILSPNVFGGWAHGRTSDDSLKKGRYELWHTRLGVHQAPDHTAATTGPVTETPQSLRTVRAIWTRDPEFVPSDPTVVGPGTQPGFDDVTSLIPDDRMEIVHLSSNFRDLGSYVPKAVDVNRLMLSTLGAWLDSHADFTLDSPLNVVAWTHKAAMARDYYVKVERKGRLYPWGHFAIKITITERKFIAPDPSTAYLWQRVFILIREPIRTYPSDWRKFPFQSIHVKTLVTPNLFNVPGGNVPTFVKTDATTPFRFKMEGVDLAGNVIQFDAPASWVPLNGSTIKPTDLRNGSTGAADYYDAYGDDRIAEFHGQRIALSPNARSDDTTYETQDILFDGTVGGEQDPDITFSGGGLPYAPGLKKATITVEAIRHLVDQHAPTEFDYHKKYLQYGFPASPSDTSHPNLGELFLKVKDATAPIGLDFTKKSDSSGGFLAPSLDINGLSRKTGPVCGDLDKIASNTFDPKEFLKSINAMIFGVIPLSDIIAAVDDLTAAPNFITQAVDAVTGFLEDLATIQARVQEVIDKAGTDLSAIQTKIDDVVSAVNALLGSFSSDGDLDTAIDDAKTVIDDLGALFTTLLSTIDDLPDSILFSFKQDLKRRIQSILDVLQTVKDGLDAFAKGLELAKNLTVKLDWRAPLQADDAGFFVPDSDGGFILSVEVRGKKVGDKPAGVDVVAGIEKFDVNVFGTSAKIVTIGFERLVFKVESGKKPDVDVVFKGPIGFDGILGFVETLAELIPAGGFSDPPSIDVDSEGIHSAFSIPIPSVAVGVLSIENISIGCGFDIPFIGNPLSVSFNFCTRDEPFVLTVMCIGGGGFFGIQLSPAGLLLLEASFEACAELSLDLGVASGSVSLAVGIYFRLEESGGTQEGQLTGFVKIHGEVDVLGLITASITLELDLTYEFASGKLVGKATLTIEVSIAFFSFSVDITVERKLAGSGSDPTFEDQMSDYLLADGVTVAHPWQDYLEAFVLAA